MTPTLSLVNDKDYAQIVTDLLPEIRKAVSVVCLLQRHDIKWDEIDDLCQQTALLLIQSDYRRLRSFDHTRSSLKTWLRAVIRNHLRRYEKKQQLLQTEEKICTESFGYWPALETDLLSKERWRALEQALSKLTRREKQLYEFLCRDDLSTLERARLLGIEVETVYRRKHALIRKLQELMSGDGGFMPESKKI